jgi:hypothetical protein
MAWVEIMLPSARTLPTGKLTQNPIRTGERRCILYGDDSGTTLAWDHATHLQKAGDGAQIRRERDDRADIQVAIRPAVEAVADSGSKRIVDGRVAERTAETECLRLTGRAASVEWRRLI